MKGNVDNDLRFEYGEEANAHNGCGATLMGEMWYFGGSSNKRQVSCIDSIQLNSFHHTLLRE